MPVSDFANWLENGTPNGLDPQEYAAVSSMSYIWDVATLTWIKDEGGGGGGGGAVTIADGADVAQGTTTDVAWVAGAGTTIGILKAIAGGVGGGLTDAELRASAVPVSAATLPLPTGAATEATLAGLLTDAQLRASAVPVSAASLPLPTGAATAALQTQPGVDIGDVTVNNTSGAGAVNIQDGGNSITVDGTVSVSSMPTTFTVAVEAYAIRLDEASSTITYVGRALPSSLTSSAVWAIKRLDSTSGLVVLWADGNTSFDNIWDNRAALSYS